MAGAAAVEDKASGLGASASGPGCCCAVGTSAAAIALVGDAGRELNAAEGALLVRHVSLCCGQSESWQARPQYFPPHRVQRLRATNKKTQ